MTKQYRRLLRTRNRIMEYERLVQLQRQDGRTRARTEVLANLLKNEVRDQRQIDLELKRLDDQYKLQRRDDWKKWQRESLVNKPGRVFAYCKRTAPDSGPGDLHWGERHTPPSMDERMARAKEEWTQ